MLTIVSKELLEKAVSIHGHLGPFLVLGLKIGLRAEGIIGKPVACEVTTLGRKPYLCVVDGLKTVMGGNIVVREGEDLSATLSNSSGNKVILRVKADVIRKYAGVRWEKCEEDAYEVMGSRDEELFEF